MRNHYCVRRPGLCDWEACCMRGVKPGEVSERSTRVINLFAGPGAGKSTTAAGLFFTMKTLGYKVELVTEFAKELVYEGATATLNDQLYVLMEQDKRQRRLVGQVDWIITDSPLILAEIYVNGDSTRRLAITAEAWSRFKRYNNVNVFINRIKPYADYGRNQSEDEARIIDEKLRDLTAGMIDEIVPGSPEGVAQLMTAIKEMHS